MMHQDPIVNRVAKSPLQPLDLEDYLSSAPAVHFDLKDVLFEGLILREKDFREFLKAHDWAQYEGKNVRLHCSTDAVIPIWAYMLLTVHLQDANLVVQGDEQDLEKALILQAVNRMAADVEDNAKVVIKGCGKIQNKEYAYTEMTRALLPKVSSLMYGEPCSTVPVFKRKK
jgi:hypothetical protein